MITIRMIEIIAIIIALFSVEPLVLSLDYRLPTAFKFCMSLISLCIMVVTIVECGINPTVDTVFYMVVFSVITWFSICSLFGLFLKDLWNDSYTGW